MSSQSSLARDKPDFFDIGLAGRYYNTGRGPLSVPSGQNLRLLGVNPAGSGKLVIVHRIRFFTNTPLEFLDLRVNPTTGLPTFALTSTSQRLGSPNGSAVVTCDVSGTPLGGGVLAPNSDGVPHRPRPHHPARFLHRPELQQRIGRSLHGVHHPGLGRGAA